MASRGYYKVSVTKGQPTDWEIKRAGSARLCWGVELETSPNVNVNVHSADCVGNIPQGMLYLNRPHRMDPVVRWSSCLYCVMAYTPDVVEGELLDYKAITDEDIEAAKKDLQEILIDLHNMKVPGGWAASRKPPEYRDPTLAERLRTG